MDVLMLTEQQRFTFAVSAGELNTLQNGKTTPVSVLDIWH